MKAILAAVLGAFGFRKLTTATCVEEAKRIFSTELFDLVLCDYRVADGCGLEFVRWLRQLDRRPEALIPVIMISAHSQRSRILDAVSAGVDEFLVKPVRPVYIARRIDACAFRRRNFIRSATYFGPDRRRHDIVGYSGPRRRDTDSVTADDGVFELE